MNKHAPLRRAAAALFLSSLLGPLATPVAAVAPTIANPAPRALTSVRFRFMADGAVRGGFAQAGKRLMFGSESGSFYALDMTSGAPLWRTNVGSGIASIPVTDGRLTYFTSWDNSIHALDVGNGRQRWKRALGRDVGRANYWDYYSASPILAGGTLYVGSGDGKFYALDGRSGRVKWSYDAGARIRTKAALTDDKVLFGTNSGHIISLDRASGRLDWKFATVGAAQNFSFKNNDTRSIVAAPVIADGLVLAGGRDGNLYGIDLATGKERWRSTHDGGSWILGLAAGAGRLYSNSGSAFIVQAADAATGKELWRTPTGNAMFGGIIKVGDMLISSGMKGDVFGFDASTGRRLWQHRLPDMSFATPAVADGAVFAASDDGTVVALEVTGSEAPPFKRLVYAFGNQPDAGYYWFTREIVDSIKAGFVAAGYTPAGTAEFAAAARDPKTAKHSIIAIGDMRLPDGVDGVAIRRLLDAGATLVMFGPNPLALTFDPKTGAPVSVDDAAAAVALGIVPLDREADFGYNVSQFGPGAARFGLSGRFVSSSAIRPDQVSLVLATDRIGMATAWAKKFDNGGLLINLPVPRNRPVDMSAAINAVQLLAVASANDTLIAK